MIDGPLTQLLHLASAKASGELVCDAGSAEIHVFLQAGRIVWASDSQHPHAFTQHLKERAGLDAESLEHAAAECHKSNVPLGETLVAWKLATSEQVRAALRHQVRLALATLEQHPSGGKAVFLSRPPRSQFAADLTFDAHELLSAGRPAAPGAAASTADPNRASPAGSGPPATPPPRAPGPGPSRVLLVAAAVAIVAIGALVVKVTWPSRSGTGPETTPTKAATAAEQGSSGAGSAAPDLVFGMSSPFSGAVKEMGRAMRTGVEVAFAVANEKGGVNGRKLQLVALDDGYDPTRALAVVQDLVENRKVFGIVGNVGTTAAAASLPYVTEKKVLLFGALTGGSFLRKRPPDRYVFNYRPSQEEETEAAVRYLLEVRRIPASRIAVLHQDDEFGRAGLASAEGQLRKLGKDPAPTVRLSYRRGSADVSAAIAQLRKERSRLQAVVMIATSQAAIQFIQQAKDLGGGLVFTNVSTVESNALAEGLVGAGKGYTGDVVVTQIVPLPTSRATAALEYQSALARHASGEPPGFITFEGYIVGSILVEGLRRAGKDPNTESLVEALESVRDLDLGIGTLVSFSPGDHQGSHKVWGTMLQADGSYKSIRLE